MKKDFFDIAEERGYAKGFAQGIAESISEYVSEYISECLTGGILDCMAKSEAKGIEMGIAEGRESLSIEIIKHMRTLGKSDLEIAEVLEWDVKEINRVAAM